MQGRCTLISSCFLFLASPIANRIRFFAIYLVLKDSNLHFLCCENHLGIKVNLPKRLGSKEISDFGSLVV